MAAPTSSLTGIKVEFLEFPATITPAAGPVKSYFLGGAGVRGLDINGTFIKFTGIGVYLEETALPSLSSKWKGKTEDELVNSIDFFRDIITGPYEKLIRGSKILPLAGKEYVSKVSENCVAHLKTVGTYSDEEEKAVAKFIEAFREQHFPPGASVFYRQSPKGTLSLSFSKDETLPKDEAVTIENKPLSEAVLETMIGEHAVSPALKQSLASRLYKLFNEENHQPHDSVITEAPKIN